jgi:hypothetical protein
MTSLQARLLVALLSCLAPIVFLSSAPQDSPTVPSSQAASKTAGQAAAQSAPKTETALAMSSGDLAVYVKKEFGPAFTLSPVVPHGAAGQLIKGAQPILLLTGDLDGDGMEDAVIVTQVKNALLDQQQFNYKVADPYNGYFGFGDPRITHQFATQEPEREHALLVVHSWRQTAPKAKFVIINLPFDSLSLSRAMIKKKVRLAIVTEEGGMVHSSVYWDGKRYQYEPDTGDTID